MAKSNKKNTRKEYKGLGDIIETVTEVTGIKKVVEAFSDATGIDCGCEERKEKLNELFKFKRKPLCFTQDEYNRYDAFVNTRSDLKLEKDDLEMICNLYAKIFQVPYYKPCLNCSPAPYIKMIEDLDLIYNSYLE